MRHAGINRRHFLGLSAAGVCGLAVRAAEESGPRVEQVTTEEFDQSNIYCEVPYASRTSRYFVYMRTNPKLSLNRSEVIVVELGTWKQHLLDTAVGLGGSAITHDGVFYYLKREEKGSGGRELLLVRADLDEGKPQVVHRRPDGPWVRSLGTVSADKKLYAGGVLADEKWSSFGILLVDLEKGEERIIDRDPSILNPHPQFEPGRSKVLLIQHNRGGRFSPDGKLEQLVGPEGATLYLLSVADGKRTELKVGKPYTTPATGHEAWIGTTQEVLLSVAASGEFAPEKGSLLAVRPGRPARVAGSGYRFNHVGVSRCGRFFCCDDWRGSYTIVVGSLRTGRSSVLCDSKTVPNRSQNTHPHAYVTPDLKWVIFNSNRTGFPHIHAASVPEGMLEKLEKA